jgi:hypothetical protein
MATPDTPSITARVDECVRLIIDLGLASPNELVGASDADLSSVEMRYGPIRIAYRRFLERAGRQAGRFLRGTNAFLPEILVFRDEPLDLQVPAGAKWSLAPTDILVASHQGYVFTYLESREDDPPVMGYKEGETGPARLGDRFSDWICESIREEAALWKSLDEKQPRPAPSRLTGAIRRLSGSRDSRPR